MNIYLNAKANKENKQKQRREFRLFKSRECQKEGIGSLGLANYYI